jgi:signal transduction histidine kinase
MIVQVKLQQIVFEGQLCELIMLEDVSTLFELIKEKQIKAEIKESFACIQHEMKNCVTFILTFTDLLLRDCLDSQLQFLEPLKEAAKLLMFTMSDWLDNT